MAATWSVLTPRLQLRAGPATLPSLPLEAEPSNYNPQISPCALIILYQVPKSINVLALPTPELWEMYFCCSEATSLWWCKKQWAKMAGLATGLLPHGAWWGLHWGALVCLKSTSLDKVSNFYFVCLFMVRMHEEAGGTCYNVHVEVKGQVHGVDSHLTPFHCSGG